MCMILQNKGRYTLQEHIVDVKSTRRKRKKLDHSLAGCGKMSSNFGQQKTALATNTSNVIYILLIQSFLNKCLFMKQSLTICDDVFSRLIVGIVHCQRGPPPSGVRLLPLLAPSTTAGTATLAAPSHPRGHGPRHPLAKRRHLILTCTRKQNRK